MAKTRDKDLRRFVHAQHSAYFSAFADRDSLLEAFKASVGNNVSEVAGQLDAAGAADRGRKGRDRHAAGPAQARWRCCRTATLDVIPGVGHLIHYETPEPAARFIRRFLKDHAA